MKRQSCAFSMKFRWIWSLIKCDIRILVWLKLCTQSRETVTNWNSASLIFDANQIKMPYQYLICVNFQTTSWDAYGSRKNDVEIIGKIQNGAFGLNQCHFFFYLERFLIWMLLLFLLSTVRIFGIVIEHRKWSRWIIVSSFCAAHSFSRAQWILYTFDRNYANVHKPAEIIWWRL